MGRVKGWGVNSLLVLVGAGEARVYSGNGNHSVNAEW